MSTPPSLIGELRTALHPALAGIANRWGAALGVAGFPADHAGFLARCHAAGQSRPTPLLRYGPGDHNCLHQDLYGDLHFPLQAALLLSRPGENSTGGEFMLTEQRPRMQPRAEVVALHRGEAVVFATNQRPVAGCARAIATCRASSSTTPGNGFRPSWPSPSRRAWLPCPRARPGSWRP